MSTPSKLVRFLKHYGSILFDWLKGFLLAMVAIAVSMTSLTGFFYLITLGMMKLHWVNPAACFVKEEKNPVWTFSMLFMLLSVIALVIICAIVQGIRQMCRTWKTI